MPIFDKAHAHEHPEHPVDQPVRQLVVVDHDHERSIEGVVYRVGERGVTKIEPTIKSGEYSYIPYFRVWIGNDVEAEVCQHKCARVFYERQHSDEEEAP